MIFYNAFILCNVKFMLQQYYNYVTALLRIYQKIPNAIGAFFTIFYLFYPEKFTFFYNFHPTAFYNFLQCLQFIHC